MRSIPLLFAAALVVLAGCDAATDSAAGAAPDVITPAAFSFDTGGFTSETARTASPAGQNFRVASVRVGLVSAIVGLNLVLPEAATRAATRVEPERREDGALVYEAVVDVLGTPVEIRLTGKPRGSEVDWTLTTAEDGSERFTYYTATTTFNGRSGSWRLFNPDEDGSVLAADFEVDGTPEVTFTIPEGRPNAGASVRYESDGSLRLFDFTDGQGVRTVVRWDAETRVGSIEADDFRQGARVCWNADLEDAACESV